jgi:hypothetical protein
MRITFEVPASWQVTTKPGRVTYTVEPGVSVDVPPLAPLPEDLWWWSQTAAERDVPKGATQVKITNRDDRKTAVGWPIAMYESVALDANEKVIESRIHIVFAMLDYGAIAVAYAGSVEKLAARRDEILAMIDSARPDWGYPADASLTALLQA